MSIISGLRQASLNRVPFLVRGGTSPDFGRKTVVHDFINTSSRYVEDLGKRPQTFQIDAEITDTTWSAYKRKKDRLEKVLNTAGIKRLVHPTYGVQKVVTTVNDISENLYTNLNVATYSITCLVSSKNIFPTSKAGNKNFINRLFDTVFGENQTVLADTTDFISKGIDVFNDGRDTIQDLTQTINDTVSTINGVADEVAAFVNDINNFQTSLTSLMQAPADLAARFDTIFNNISVITENFRDLFDVSLNIVGAGSNRVELDGTSATTNTLNNNRSVIYAYSDVASLSVAYQASTNISFQNQEDLDSTQQLLDDAFASIDPDRVDDTVYYNLQNIRNQTRLFLDSLRLNLANIIDKRVNQIPSSVLAYNLYEDSDRSDEIILLNTIEDPAFVSGNIRVLSR